MGKIRIGVSGWSYPEWKGVFYPDDLPDGDQLAYATRTFDTIEINGTFYSLTDPKTCRRWRKTAPRTFRFAVKGSRYITHIKRLTDAGRPLANFFASGILELGQAMGPILWQLPADFVFDPEAIDRFLAALPRDTATAAELAKDHDDRVREVSYGDGENHRIRHVLEFRHASFETEETARMARRHGVALCSSHSGEWPYVEEISAGFVYVRLHGPGELYASAYSDSDLDRWAERVRIWASGQEPGDSVRISGLQPPERKERDVYVYFDNTAEGHAPDNARYLIEQIDER